MAAKKKTAATRSKPASSTFNELEKTAESLLRELGHLFDTLSEKTAEAARAVASTTTSLTNQVTSAEYSASKHIQGLLAEAQKAGERLVQSTGELYDGLMTKIGDAAPSEAKKTTKKKMAKVASKKKTTKKRTASTKKKVSKKKARPRRTAG